ncbi:MAG: hypothetical protein NZ804_03435 [Roseibacillus sp.]|uniref:MoxR-like ATPases n=1 Tax=uncultured verrucomicrobium HF0500_18J03 TaxID=723599 RepID=E7C5A1_9BACT|nr:MoxR-like ATPases [uncultured verrucomicrobium HF0500_18J03]MCS5539024.1 hypothetical protein [Roseibacillus sp.]
MSSPHPSSERTAAYIHAIRERVAKIVVGQEIVVERMLIALLTSGHLLLEGVPGLAKTLLAFLERLRAYEGLSKDRRRALKSEITLLQDRFFGPGQESEATTDLHEIALKWKPAA